MKCRYPLHGLPVGSGVLVCPECGTAVPAGGFALFGFEGPAAGKRTLTLSDAVQAFAWGAGPFLLIRLLGGVSPQVMWVTLALLVVGLLIYLAWHLWFREKPERPPVHESELPQALPYLLAGPAGVSQHSTRLVSWDDFVGLRVQCWPGGVRFTARRRLSDARKRWRRIRNVGQRPLDFIVPCRPEHVHALRRIVREWAGA